MKGRNKNMAPLGLLSKGEKAEIVEIKTQRGYNHRKSKNELCHAEDIGLRVGKVIEMLNNEGRGPLLLKVDESRIAIGRGMAMKIMVKKTEQ
jgi:ferrous iron transport protein A